MQEEPPLPLLVRALGAKCQHTSRPSCSCMHSQRAAYLQKHIRHCEVPILTTKTLDDLDRISNQTGLVCFKTLSRLQNVGEFHKAGNPRRGSISVLR